jgi:uncharacterized protein YndB with AHSA1/START domain
MSRKPTGHVRGNELILTRTFRASIEDVWTSVTASESTARWIGRWEGEAGPGKSVRLQLLFEKGEPWADVSIEACEAPRHLVVKTTDEAGAWRLELTLTQTGETTELRFVHHLSDRKLAGDVGPGWEYYLDMLVAARDGQPLPAFEEYYPAQKAHYSGGV